MAGGTPGGLDAAYLTVGKRRIRALNGIDFIYPRLYPTFGPKVRRGLCQALRHASDEQPSRGSIHVHVEGQQGRTSVVDVPLDRPAEETLVRLEEMERTARVIGERECGGVIRGTNAEAHRIAALTDGGMSLDEILADYPNLIADQVEAALVYATGHPRRRRPYPRSTAKLPLQNGRGGLERAFAAARDNE